MFGVVFPLVYLTHIPCSWNEMFLSIFESGAQLD